MLINQLLTKGLPFVVYRLPGENEPVFLVQKSCDVQQSPLIDMEQQKGFVIAPFDSYKSKKAFIIKPDVVARHEEERKKLLASLASLPDREVLLPKANNLIISKKDYLQQVKTLISRIKNGEVRKVVLSRVIEKLLPWNFDFDLFYYTFQQSYPNTFVYLFQLPGEGIWTGATPETLLNRNGSFYETMALAGTQKRLLDGMPIRWDEKEKEEQAYVTGFVEEQIKSLAIKNYERSQAETVFAGSLAHICTRFRFPVGDLQGNTGRFVSLLHPTPAVCGLPKEKAWQLISETENHRRHFYSGFLGPWQLEKTAHLFVNLRCARFTKDKYELYVGGGLTAASNPEKEWQETEDKATTILKVLEKICNFAP